MIQLNSSENLPTLPTNINDIFPLSSSVIFSDKIINKNTHKFFSVVSPFPLTILRLVMIIFCSTFFKFSTCFPFFFSTTWLKIYSDVSLWSVLSLCVSVFVYLSNTNSIFLFILFETEWRNQEEQEKKVNQRERKTNKRILIFLYSFSLSLSLSLRPVFIILLYCDLYDISFSFSWIIRNFQIQVFKLFSWPFFPLFFLSFSSSFSSFKNRIFSFFFKSIKTVFLTVWTLTFD